MPFLEDEAIKSKSHPAAVMGNFRIPRSSMIKSGTEANSSMVSLRVPSMVVRPSHRAVCGFRDRGRDAIEMLACPNEARSGIKETHVLCSIIEFAGHVVASWEAIAQLEYQGRQ